MDRKRNVIVCLSLALCIVFILCACDTNTSSVKSSKRQVGKVSNISLSRGILSSNIEIFSEKDKIDEVLGWFDGIKLTKQPMDEEYSMLGLKREICIGVFSKETGKHFGIQITNERKVYMSVVRLIDEKTESEYYYVSAEGVIDMNEFAKKYKI